MTLSYWNHLSCRHRNDGRRKGEKEVEAGWWVGTNGEDGNMEESTLSKSARMHLV
jgi:hypothetical protein